MGMNSGAGWGRVHPALSAELFEQAFKECGDADLANKINTRKQIENTGQIVKSD
jgi:hypothetical protein